MLLSSQEVLAKQKRSSGQSSDCPEGHGISHVDDASSKEEPQKYESGGATGIGANVGVGTAFDPSSLQRV